MTSKEENLLCCLIGSLDPFGCLSVTGFSFSHFLGSGDLTEMFFLCFLRSQIFCLSFQSAFAAFCFSFAESVSDMSRSELADASVDAALQDEDCGAPVMSTGSVCVAASTYDNVPPALFVGWLVVLGFNGPLRHYFSLYRAVSQREGERGKKG